MENQHTPSAGSASGPSGSPNLYLEPGETVLLSPESQRFSACYKRAYPRDIDEVRSILGLTDSAAKSVRAKGCCQRYCAPGVLYSPDAFSSDNRATQRRAKEIAVELAYRYVMGADAASLIQWKPFLDRYLEIGKALLNWAVLLDIEISDGATLVISASTNALYARNIKIHGAGRMWCKGNISIKCTTLQGIKMPHPAVGATYPRPSLQN